MKTTLKLIITLTFISAQVPIFASYHLYNGQYNTVGHSTLFHTGQKSNIARADDLVGKTTIGAAIGVGAIGAVAAAGYAANKLYQRFKNNHEQEAQQQPQENGAATRSITEQQPQPLSRWQQMKTKVSSWFARK